MAPIRGCLPLTWALGGCRSPSSPPERFIPEVWAQAGIHSVKHARGLPGRGCKVCTLRITTLHPTGPAGQSPRHHAPSSPGNLASCEAACNAVWLGSSGTRSREPDALRSSGSSIPQRREGPSPAGPLPWAQQPGPPPVTPLSPCPAAFRQFQVLFLQWAGPYCKRGGQWSV